MSSIQKQNRSTPSNEAQINTKNNISYATFILMQTHCITCYHDVCCSIKYYTLQEPCEFSTNQHNLSTTGSRLRKRGFTTKNTETGYTLRNYNANRCVHKHTKSKLWSQNRTRIKFWTSWTMKESHRECLRGHVQGSTTGLETGEWGLLS